MTTSAVVRLIAWAWLFAAIGASHFGFLERLPALGLPVLAAALVVALVIVQRRSSALRRWLDALSLRTLVLLHLVRVVSYGFLYFANRGEVPRSFAVQVAGGEIIVAIFALPIALWATAQPQRLRFVYIWNVVGLLNVLLLTVSASRLALADTGAVQLFTRVPLSLLPTFLGPLIVASHLLISQRLTAAERARAN